MNQTAVKWFSLKVMYLKMNPKEIRDFLDWYEEALKMEKQQIEDAFDEGLCEGFDYATIKDTIDSDTGKQYYYETYGKDA